MNTSNMNTSVTNINKLGFDSIWSGSAYQAQSAQLTDTMTQLNQCIKDLNQFDIILQKRDKYVQICSDIKTLSGKRASCASSHTKETKETGCGNCTSLTSRINALEKERKLLREEIIGLLGQFVGIDAEIEPPADLSGIADGILTFEEQQALTEIYMAMPAGNIANNLVGKTDENGVVIEDGYAYIQQRIDEIKSQYTGSERNYYVAMEVIEISILAGVRSPYEHNGTGFIPGTTPSEATRAVVSTKWLSDGIDCNAYASLVIFDENSTQGWLEVGQFTTAGIAVNYEDAKPGDVFCNGGHVGIVMANDPETKQLIINHASGQQPDMKYEVVSYQTLQNGGNKIRRLDSTYVSERLK